MDAAFMHLSIAQPDQSITDVQHWTDAIHSVWVAARGVVHDGAFHAFSLLHMAMLLLSEHMFALCLHSHKTYIAHR